MRLKLKCVNALLQAFAFLRLLVSLDNRCICVNALLQAFAFLRIVGTLYQKEQVLC